MRVLFFAILFLSLTSNAADIGYGTFIIVKGNVLIQSAGSAATQAKINTKVNSGDTVITDADSRAKVVVFHTRNILNIMPNTKITFEKIVANANEKVVKVNLKSGKVRASVGDKFTGKSEAFEIRTATAVSGVRGTDFIVSHSSETNLTEVVTLRGVVTLRNIAESAGATNISREVFVNQNERATVKDGSAPTNPVLIAPGDLDQIKVDSTVEKDRNAEVKSGVDVSTKAPETTDASGGAVNTSPIFTPVNFLPDGGLGSQRLRTPVKIKIK